MDLFQLWGSVGIRTAEAFESLDQVEQRVTGLAQKMGTTLQNAGDKMQSVGAGMTSAGAGMTAGITAPIAAVAVAAGSAAIEVQKSASNIAMSLGVTKEQADKLSESAQNVWKDGFGESLDEVNSALINVKQNMTGVKEGAELETVTRDAMLLAKTFDSDINEVTRAGQNLMKNFGISSQQAFDMMAAGGQRGLNFSNEMFDNLAEYTPLFATMGYSAEEMFGILERGSKAGVYNLDYVNDVMKEFQIRVKDGSKGTSDAMEQLSAGTQKVWKDFLAGKGDVKDVASTVVGELQAMDDQVLANQIGVGLFGTKWEDLEASAMYAMLGTNKAMDGYSGKMDQLAKDSETFEQKWNSFLRTAQSALIPIGIILLDIAEEWLPKIAAVVEKVAKGFEALPEGVQKMIVFGGAFLALAGPIMLVIGTIVTGLGAATSGVGMLVKSFGSLTGSLLKLPSLIGKVFGAFAGASGASRAVDSVTDSVDGAGRRNRRRTPDVDVQPDVGGRRGARGGGKNPFAKLPDMASKAAKGVGKAFSGMGKMIARVGAMFLPMLATPMGLAITAVIAVVAGGVYLLVKHWDTVKTTAIKAFTALGDFFKQWGTAFVSAISGAVSAVVGAFSSAWSALSQATRTAFEAIKNTISTIMGAIQTAMSSVLSAILQVVQSVWNSIKSVITTILNAIKSVAVSIWSAIQSFITSTLNALKSVITSVWNAIKSFITSTMNAIKSTITSVWNAIKSVVTSVVNGIKSVVQGAFNSMRNIVTSVMGTIRSVVSAGFSAMKSAATSAASVIKSSIVGAFNAIKNIAGNAVKWGSDIISGLVKGITGNIKKVTSAVGNVAKSVGNTFKKMMGIKSPSRLFMKFGGFIGEGLAIGMEKTADLVAKASEFMGGSIQSPDPITVPPPLFPDPPTPTGPNPGGAGTPVPTGARASTGTGDGVIIQNATFQINLEKVHTDEDVNKLRRAIQTVVTDDLFGMAVRNV